MNILVISNIKPVAHLGSGYVVKNFYEGLFDRGNSIKIIDPQFYWLFSGKFKFGFRYQLMLGQLWYIIKNWKSIKVFDTIIFIGGISSLSILFIKKITRYKGRLVHHTNGPENKYFSIGVKYGVTQKKWYHISESLLSYFSFKLPDLIVTVSQDDRDWLFENNFPKSGKVLSINPALNGEFIGVEVVCSEKKPVIAFCGNWIPLKGIDLILQVIPDILSIHSDWEFWILGEKYPDLVHNLFPVSVQPRVKVYPFMEEKADLMALYKQVSIHILPSYYESFGLVMLESMACACALVTTRVGLGCELVSGEHALIMEEKTPQALYDHITTLIQDPELLRRLGKGGYAFAQGFTWEKAVGTLDWHLKSLIEDAL